MAHLSIKQLHLYLTGEMVKEVRDRYWHYRILSEADLQSVVWQLLHSFIERHDPEFDRYRILNKPYLQGLRIHPDIVVFEDRKPWVVIELKEGKKLSPKAAKQDWKRLLKAKKAFSAHRGYLVYVARYGPDKFFSGPKKKAAKYFFEVPIVLGSMYPPARISKWESEYRFWAKYTHD